MVVRVPRGRSFLPRRRFLAGLAAFVCALPVLRAIRVRAEDYVERDGWVLKRSDLERERGR